MALETLTVQHVTRVGAEVTRESVTTVGGFEFLNDGKTILLVTEQNSADCDITFTPVPTVDGSAAAAKTVTVASGEEWVLGPFPPQLYNDADGYVTCTIEADEASAIAALSLA